MTSMLGLISLIILILTSIFIKGSLFSFIDIASFLIVLGGTLSASIITNSPKEIAKAKKALKKVIFENNYDFKYMLDEIVRVSVIIRNQGVLSGEKLAKEIDNEFFKKGLYLITDGIDPKEVESILEEDIQNNYDKDEKNEDVIRGMAELSPAFGMIGTLIGLILMLKNLDDVSTLGPNMGVALVTTFYGVFLANGIFTPFANKLEKNKIEKSRYKTMIKKGLLAIQSGESTILIKEKLSSYIDEDSKIEGEVENEEKFKKKAS